MQDCERQLVDLWGKKTNKHDLMLHKSSESFYWCCLEEKVFLSDVISITTKWWKSLKCCSLLLRISENVKNDSERNCSRNTSELWNFRAINITLSTKDTPGKIWPIRKTLLKFLLLHGFHGIINKLTLKDNTVSYCFTLFIFGGPCHLSVGPNLVLGAFFSSEQLVYSVINQINTSLPVLLPH